MFAESEFTFELRKGARRGEEVPFHLSSPMEPLNPSLAPPGAFCLIPDRPLSPRTKYFVSAHATAGESRSLHWSFTTGTEN